MKCYICGNEISSPVIDARDGKVKPCTECLVSVDSALNKWKTPDHDDVGETVELDQTDFDYLDNLDFEDNPEDTDDW